MTPSPQARYAAIITAAGASTRMGSPKALVSLRGVPLLLHQLRVLEHAGAFDPIVIVLGSEAAAIAEHVARWGTRARLVINERWAQGRSTSLEAAAKAIMEGEAMGASAKVESPSLQADVGAGPRLAGLLVVAVDQPLDAEVVRALLAAGPGPEVLIPSFAGRRGHPVVLPGALLSELTRASRHPEGLRDIVRGAAARIVEVATPRIHLDLNTPDDLAGVEGAR